MFFMREPSSKVHSTKVLPRASVLSTRTWYRAQGVRSEPLKGLWTPQVTSEMGGAWREQGGVLGETWEGTNGCHAILCAWDFVPVPMAHVPTPLAPC